MLISRNLHTKSSEVSIKTRSTPASLSLKGQATKHTIVKWSITTFELICTLAWHTLMALIILVRFRSQSHAENIM